MAFEWYPEGMAARTFHESRGWPAWARILAGTLSAVAFLMQFVWCLYYFLAFGAARKRVQAG